MVVITCQTCINNVDKDNFFSMTLESFSQFNTNVTSTYNRYTFDILRFVVQFINNFLSVLEKFNELKVFKCSFESTATFFNFGTFDWRQDWLRTCCQNQFVIWFNMLFTIYEGCNSFTIKVNRLNWWVHINFSALAFKSFFVGIEKTIRTWDLITDPKGHTTTQEWNVRVLVENNYFILVSVIIENSINTKSTSVVSTNNYDCWHKFVQLSFDNSLLIYSTIIGKRLHLLCSDFVTFWTN